jgi:FkbH-like protein
MTTQDGGPADDVPHRGDRLGGRQRVDAARVLTREGRVREAARLLGGVADVSTELPVWLAAQRQLARLDPQAWSRRQVRVGLVGSATTSHLAALLHVAAARHGVALEVYEGPYGQYQQEVLDPGSGLHAFRPDVVVLAVDQRELHLPNVSATPEQDLAAEVQRWTSTWATVRERLGAVVIQPTFVPTDVDVFRNLALSLPGSRRRQVRRLNLELGERAGDGVFLVDAEMVAATTGLHVWADDRYWFLSKHAVGLGAVPAFAREVGTVLAAALGLSRKVIVLDLDNTLWGGVVGEDGVAGLALGDGPAGEAYVAFQEHLLDLRRRGVLLAVVSKNNDADARAPFLEHPDMRLRLEDFAAFRATWQDKPAQIRALADELSLGLDSFLFVDDNPFEREGVRQALPEVEVLDLPDDATGYVQALAAHPGLEPAAFTEEDTRRTQAYRALAAAAQTAAAAGTREDFLRDLDMEATFEPVGEANLRRVVQLVGKTNQFNLTTRRHTAAAVTALLARPGAVGLALRLRDRFADHGLVGVVLAAPEGTDLVVDTWLMSCRVLGRGADVVTMRVLAEHAAAAGFGRLVGDYLPTDRNAPAESAFKDAGFTLVRQEASGSRWALTLGQDRVPDPGILRVRPAAPAPAAAGDG